MRTTAPRQVSWLAHAGSIVVACMVLAACGGGGAGGTSPSPGGGTSPSTGGGARADGFPVTIQNCGRTLTFDQPPSRAVLPYHPMAEIFVGLRLAARAVGRAGFTGGIKEPPILPEQAADFERIPVVSDNSYPPPKEQLLSLRPDFLLAYADFDYGGKNQGAAGLATLDELGAVGVQAYTVVCPDEAGGYTNENIDATYRTILDLGKIFGVSDRAERRVAEMKAQIADISQKVSAQPVVKVIAYFGGEGPLNLVGGGNILFTQIIKAAGGANVFAEANTYDLQASLETVATEEVDAFVIFADSEDATDTLDGTKEAQSSSPRFRTRRPARTVASSSPTSPSPHPAGATHRRSRTWPGGSTRTRSSK